MKFSTVEQLVVIPKRVEETPSRVAGGSATLGELTEVIRAAITRKYGVFPPEIQTLVSEDGSVYRIAVTSSHRKIFIDTYLDDEGSGASPELGLDQSPGGGPQTNSL